MCSVAFVLEEVEVPQPLVVWVSWTRCRPSIPGAANRLPATKSMAIVSTFALSNGIPAVISRPRFSDAAFAVGDEDAHVTLRIKY